MKSCRQRPTVLQEDLRQRPDLTTLTCVNPDCQRFRLTGQNNLTVRKVYGQDRIRLLRCRTCGEEFSERCGTALFNTKIAEEQAESIINHVDARMRGTDNCASRPRRQRHRRALAPDGRTPRRAAP
jgi:hypothetical protein